MSFKPLRLLPLAALAVIGACDTIHPNGSVDPGFGESARYNAALQIVDPDPQIAQGAAVPGDNGAMGAAAAKRYRTNTVKAIDTVKTTGSTGSSSPPRG